MKTPIEQRAKPVKKRRLKNADLEEDFFFILYFSRGVRGCEKCVCLERRKRVNHPFFLTFFRMCFGENVRNVEHHF